MATAAVEAPPVVEVKTILYYSIYPEYGVAITTGRLQHEVAGKERVTTVLERPIILTFKKGRCEVTPEVHERIVSSEMYGAHWGFNKTQAGEWAPAHVIGTFLDSDDQDEQTLAKAFIRLMFHHHTNSRNADILLRNMEQVEFVEAIRKELGMRGFTKLGRFIKDADKVAEFAAKHKVPVETARKILEDALSMEAPKKKGAKK